MPPTLSSFLTAYETYYIVGHIEPDGDCIGASLALASFLERVLLKQAHCLNAGPFDRREIQRYQDRFSTRLDPDERRRSPSPAAIILDCTGPDRIGRLADDIKGLPTAVIDHHASGVPYGDARFVEPTTAATCYLVQLALEQFGSLTPEEAQWLLFGIATDTGYFRHLESNASDLFAAIGRLMGAGASPRQAHVLMFAGHTMDSRQLLGTLLQRAQPFGNGTGIISWETADDVQRYGRESRDSDTLYQLLFSISGVRTAALIRQESPTTISGSLRSIDDLDVSVVAGLFGGGGHRRAAGFTAELPLETAVERVRAELDAAVRSAAAEEHEPGRNQA